MTERSLEGRTRLPLIATTSEERTWAAIAHVSTMVTLLFGLPTAGLSGVLLVFVPLLIYLAYREKSRFVAFHAAQALALQIVATVGFFVSIIAGAIVISVLALVSILLMVILIGFLLIAVTVFVAVIIAFLWVAFPFVVGGFSIVAAIETGSGRDYHYPYIGRWVEDWLAKHESLSSPAV